MCMYHYAFVINRLKKRKKRPLRLQISLAAVKIGSMLGMEKHATERHCRETEYLFVVVPKQFEAGDALQ